MTTVRNERNGRTLTTPWTHEEAIAHFLRLHPDRGDGREHWLYYWIHEYADRGVREEQARAQTVQQSRQQDRVLEGIDLGVSLRYIGDLFLVALGYGLKRPMIRAHYKDQRFKIYLSARGTVCFKSGGLETSHDGEGNLTYSHDPIGDEEYIGCIVGGGRFLPPRYDDQNSRPDGAYYWNYRARRWTPRSAGFSAQAGHAQPTFRVLTQTEREFLENLGRSPVAFLAQCSKDMDRCCYCNHQLDDPTSKRLGYGPICGPKYGLPWGDKRYTEKAPSFSKSYNETAAGHCAAIRENPQDANRWAVLNDWLTEEGLPPLAIVEQDPANPNLWRLTGPVLEARLARRS